MIESYPVQVVMFLWQEHMIEGGLISMIKWLRISLFVLNIAFYVIAGICCILGLVAEIIQPINLVRLFEYLHINLSYNGFIIVSWVCFLVAVALHFLRKKFL